MTRAARIVLGLAAVLLPAACTKHDSLILLDLRVSGPLGAPVARVRLSASDWPTRTVVGSVGPAGFRVGYYGPGNGNAVTVTAEALDDVGCVLGSGSAGVAALAVGGTSAEIRLFIRPTPASGCTIVDAGSDSGGGDDGGGEDAGEQDAGTDAGEQDAGEQDAGVDAGGEDADDAGVDGGDDAAVDAGAD